MNKLFEVHKLNDVGLVRARQIAELFDNLLTGLTGVFGAEGREAAIVKTKLEEACFFAKKALASKPENQAEEE